MTCSKYFQNNIYKTDISSVAHRSTKWISFPWTLYIFNVCNKFLHLKKFQCVNLKNNCQFLLQHIHVSKFSFIKVGFEKESKFFLPLKVNLLVFFKCKCFFHILADSCSEVIILFLFLVNIFPPLFLIYLFHETFEIVWNSGYIKGSFYFILGYDLLISQSLVSLCYA